MATSLTQSLFSSATNGVIKGSAGEFYTATTAISLAVSTSTSTLTGATSRVGLQTFIFPKNSVIEFRGGRISSNVPVILDLNGSQIDAPAYWIFNRNVYIINCGNEQIRAEWFNDPQIRGTQVTAKEEDHIKKALVCAIQGFTFKVDPTTLIESYTCSPICAEVLLETRIYNLSTSIEIAPNYYFPDSNLVFTKRTTTSQIEVTLPASIPQKISAPGTLQLLDNQNSGGTLMRSLIKVTALTVNIYANRLRGIYKKNGVGLSVNGKYLYKNYGYGIEINSRNEYSTFIVNHMIDLNRGFSIGADGATSSTNRFVQYAKFRFDSIKADYGFYIDIFDKSGTSSAFGSWFNENVIEGGRLIGGNGIYVEDYYRNSKGEVCTVDLQATGQLLKINGNTFSKIGFEGLEGIPMYLRGICASEFRSLRLAENLPGIHKNDQGQFIDFNSDATWIDLKYVSTVTMEIEGSIIPNHIKAQDSKFVIIKTWLTDMDDADRYHFDRLAFLPISEGGQYNYTTYGVASSSIQPYNMEKTLYSGDFTQTGNLYIIPLQAVLPLNDTLYQPKSTDLPKKSTCLVLPRKLTIVAEKNKPCRINLSGLHLFANFLFDIKLVVGENSSAIIEYYFYNPDKNSKGCGIVVPNYTTKTFSLVRQMEFYNAGEYAISFDDKWNLIINKL
ncbi:MAG: hypothetical protein K2G35_07600 [Duncaniella sp.]|nr:hypothetical protein [Duncaniella sp.]